LSHFQLFWEHHPAWLLPCFVFALAAAWFFYSGKQDWPKWARLSLTGIRTLVLFILLALLLNPLIRKMKENILPPVTILLVDDSESVPMGTSPDSLQILKSALKELKKKLEDDGSQVVVSGLKADLKPDSISFTGKESALTERISALQEEFDNQNIFRVILASDGINNKGPEPGQKQFPFVVHTIRLGNPNPRKDLVVSEVKANKMAFKGNTFPVSVLIKGRKLEGSPVSVSISENGKILQTRSSAIGQNGLASMEFVLKAESKGIHGYQVRVEALAGEITTANNTQNTFVEVIDGKQKILLAAAHPHPDIKAIRAALSPLGQIELDVVTGGQNAWKTDDYNLVILHQLPDRYGTFGPQVSNILKGSTPVFLIAGSHTDLARLRLEGSGWLKLQNGGFIPEEVTTAFQPDFQRFQFENEWKATLEDLPPVKSLSSSYEFAGGGEAILLKKLGKATVPTPLLAVQVQNNPKRGILWGEGFWLWRMNEYARKENFQATDNLLQKTIQLLASTDKKKKLKISQARNEYNEGEPARFFAETFNQIFEPVFNQKIELMLKRKDGKKWNYSFYNNSDQSAFQTESLEPGAYAYTGSAMLNGKLEKDEGEFLIKPSETETRELEANHASLEDLAKNNQGKSVGIVQISRLFPEEDEKPKPLISFAEWDETLLNSWWILLLIGVLVSAEWTLRKMLGNL
jgi:hypothetical protein